MSESKPLFPEGTRRLRKARIATKLVASGVIGTSAGWAAKRVLETNIEIDPQKRRREKAKAKVAGVTAGSLAASAARQWSDRKVDFVFNVIEQTYDQITAKEEQKDETETPQQ